MAQEPIPVLIVGAGLTLSLLLHQQGIASLLIERRPDVSWVATRATSISALWKCCSIVRQYQEETVW